MQMLLVFSLKSTLSIVRHAADRSIQAGWGLARK
jgi:hypothetical protein